MVKKLIPYIIIFVVSIPLKIIGNYNGYFAFTYDQGRDFIEVSKILSGNHTLIGPTTGLQGIFYGPWWYYFLAPIIFIAGGDPQKVAIFFSFLSIATLFLLFTLILKITGDKINSLLITLIAIFSNIWSVAPQLIWNPSLTPPLLILYFLTVIRIFESKKILNFLLLGIFSALILETSASFGSIVILFTLLLPILFIKEFFNKNFFGTILGILFIFLPRFIFEIRNNFLMTNSFISFLSSSKTQGEGPTLIERSLIRLNDFSALFTELFTRQNGALGSLFLLGVILLALFTLKSRSSLYQNLKKNVLLRFTLVLFLLVLVFFIIYPDDVWSYYLIGIPIIYLVIFSSLVKTFTQEIKNKLVITIMLIGLLVANFKIEAFIWDSNWQGTDADYINQIRVVNYLKELNPRDYSFYSYTPTRFDYPIDYLVGWYVNSGKLEKPKENQKNMVLVIREHSKKSDFKDGWYGDKVRDSTDIISQKTFPTDMLLEVHRFRD